MESGAVSPDSRELQAGAGLLVLSAAEAAAVPEVVRLLHLRQRQMRGIGSAILMRSKALVLQVDRTLR